VATLLTTKADLVLPELLSLDAGLGGFSFETIPEITTDVAFDIAQIHTLSNGVKPSLKIDNLFQLISNFIKMSVGDKESDLDNILSAVQMLQVDTLFTAEERFKTWLLQHYLKHEPTLLALQKLSCLVHSNSSPLP
jgi:hypothetical protein